MTTKLEKLQMMLARLGADEAPKLYAIQPPMLPPGVVPAGRKAPVLAADGPAYAFASGYSGLAAGFPGYQYLSMLATRAEYRAFASAMATELTREWVELTSDETDGGDAPEKIKRIENEMERLGVRETFQRVCEQDCYFGRGQIFIDIDGQDRETPLVLDRRTIRKGSLKGVRSVEAIWTTPAMYNALDPADPSFYKPNAWFMLGQHVHASRLLTVVTRPLPDMLKPAFNFSGISLSQLAEPYVDNWLRTRQAVADLIDNFSITGLKTSMDQLLQGEDDGAALMKRAELFTKMRSNKGLMLLDMEAEDLVQQNVPLSGLSELQAQSQEHMCAVSHMPAIVLTGISPTGLNASSEGEMEAWEKWISAQQTAFWLDPLRTVINCIQLSLFGEIDPSIGVKFKPLSAVSAKEAADIRAADGVTACGYIDRGVLSAQGVREVLARDPDSGYQGLDLGSEQLPEMPSEDESVSPEQHRAMEAAAHGHSTLGKEFVKHD